MEVRLTKEALSLDAVYGAVRGPGFGGVVLFAGNVRDCEKERSIEAIAFTSYESMARKELEKVVRAAEERYQARICVHHRLGRVPVGESSVLVAAACGHRIEAFAACREVIDRLKETVPIWKTSFIEAGQIV